MITVRPANRRGHTKISWLDSRHTFSFGDYFDEAHMGFRALRVVNDDRVTPGAGFGTHGHRDMEILTWVLSGALEHKDSIGEGGVLRPGDVQHMSAGRGVLHSEFNHSKTEPVHFLQVWIQPDKAGTTPSYAQVNVPVEVRTDRWRRVADGAGRDGALKMGADASMLVTTLTKGARLAHELDAKRHAWLHVASGRVRAHGHELSTGDGLALSNEARLEVEALEPSELLLFELR